MCIRDRLKKVGKLPVRVLKEIPGYMLNRIQTAVYRECWSLLEQGVASAEDIDLGVRTSFGFRYSVIGPLLTYDLGGLETAYRGIKNLWPKISDTHDPPLGMKKLVEAGHYGEKTGRGVFNYSRAEWDEIKKRRDKQLLQLLKVLYW